MFTVPSNSKADPEREMPVGVLVVVTMFWNLVRPDPFTCEMLPAKTVPVVIFLALLKVKSPTAVPLPIVPLNVMSLPPAAKERL